MTSSLNKISTIVEHQLPQFIRDNHPIFVEFLQKYYEFLEQPGNPIYELKKFENNYDIDATRDSLLRYFKNKILPSFPEESELSTERIIKASRDFYAKKGTVDSFKFLFRALYDKEVDIYLPKLQILRASDGKWVQPQAFRIALSTTSPESVEILSGGRFKCARLLNDKSIAVGDTMQIYGKLSVGTGSIRGYSDPGPHLYYVTSTSISESDNTLTFTLSERLNGVPLTTSPGTTSSIIFNGYIDNGTQGVPGTILHVTRTPLGGIITDGLEITGQFILPGTVIVGQLSATDDSLIVSYTKSSGGATDTYTFGFASVTNIQIGQLVSGLGVPEATFVTNISGTTVTLSKSFTVDGSGTYKFYSLGGKGTYKVNSSIFVGSLASPVIITNGLYFRDTTRSNDNLDLNLLERKKAYGSMSQASCLIESTNKTIDKASNREIIEFYVSNVNRFFRNGEYLEIDYIDNNNQKQTFSEKIIGSISNIKINPNRRGTKYHKGDPVVISGGLDLKPPSDTRRKAVAVVGNVTTGSIDSVTVVRGGYGFRTDPDSVVDIVTSSGVGAKVIVSAVDEDNGITLDNLNTDSILYKQNQTMLELSANLLVATQASPLSITATSTNALQVVTFNGYINNGTAGQAGDTLHVVTNPTDPSTSLVTPLQEGMLISLTSGATTIPYGTHIIGQMDSGGNPITWVGGTGLYKISTNSAKTFLGYITGTTLNVSSTPTSTLLVNDFVFGSILPTNIQLSTLLTGSADSSGSSWELSDPIEPSSTFTGSITNLTFNGYIPASTSGVNCILYITSVPSATLYQEMCLLGTNVPLGTYIQHQINPSTGNYIPWVGGIGAYLLYVPVDISTSIGSSGSPVTFTIAVLDVTTEPTQNGLSSNMYLSGGSIPFDTYIINPVYGTYGGIGKYSVSKIITQSSASLSADNRYYFNDADIGNILYAQTNKVDQSWGFDGDPNATIDTPIGDLLQSDPITLYPIKTMTVVNGGSFFSQVPTFDVLSLYDTDYSLDEGIILIGPNEFNSYIPNNKTLNLVGSKFSSEDGFYIGWRIFCEKHFRTIVAYNGTTKTVTLDRIFESNVTNINIMNKNLYLDSRPNLASSGIIAAVEIRSGGIGYAVNDPVTFIGPGAGATARVASVSGGKITSIEITSRGTGYTPATEAIIASPISTFTISNGGRGYKVGDTVSFVGLGSGASVTVSEVSPLNGSIIGLNVASGGSGYTKYTQAVVNSIAGAGAVLNIILSKRNAILESYIMGDGELLTAETGKIGQIKDIILKDRGSDYVITPNVSMKICDIYIGELSTNEYVIEDDIVYQGTDLENTTFYAVVDSYQRANNILRVYNYSGSANYEDDLIVVRNGAEVLTLKVLPHTEEIFVEDTGEYYIKTYPWKYGDGKAKASAEFLNGLIKYNGYYLNTDGHISADKKLQDGKQYHNFSYSIQSEVQYSDYSKTILDVAHPSGTKLLPVYVKQYGKEVGDHLNINVNSRILTTNTYIGTCNVGFESLLVDGGLGDNERFTDIASAGDMIIIKPSSSVATFAKTITGVIDDNNLTIESPCTFIGQGRAQTIASSPTMIISSNTDIISSYIAVNDEIKINSYGMQYANLLVGIGQTTTSINLYSTSFSASSVNDYYNGFTVKIVSGTGVNGSPNTSIITAYDGTTKKATISPALGIAAGATSNVEISGLVYKTVLSVAGHNVGLNSSIALLSKNNLVYEVLPKLNVVEYEIIKTGYVPD